MLNLSGVFTHWPDALENVLLQHKGQYHKLKAMSKAASRIPYWFDEPARALIYKPNIPVPEESVLCAIQIMEKRGIAVNPYSVNRFMGYRDSSVVVRVLNKR